MITPNAQRLRLYSLLHCFFVAIHMRVRSHNSHLNTLNRLIFSKQFYIVVALRDHLATKYSWQLAIRKYMKPTIKYPRISPVYGAENDLLFQLSLSVKRENLYFSSFKLCLCC